MFLDLSHTKLHVYTYANDLIVECYTLVKLLPKDERYNLVQQIKRAALSVKLNIAEGASRKSPQERKRFLEISRGSVVELDAAFEVCVKLDYLKIECLTRLSTLVNHTYGMLSKMIT
jgi:four helix bundle protein